MAEEFYDAEIYTLTDEEGVEADYKQIGVAEVGENVYYALVPLDEKGEEAGDEYIILRAETDENGDTYLATIEDDEEFDSVADLFDDEFASIDYDEEAEETRTANKIPVFEKTENRASCFVRDKASIKPTIDLWSPDFVRRDADLP